MEQKEIAHLESAAVHLAMILDSWKKRAPEAMTEASTKWLAAERRRQKRNKVTDGV